MVGKKITGNFRRNPLWYRILNGIWNGTCISGTKIRLDKDDLIRKARKATGLQELGPDFNDEPLERLLRSINEEAALHPAGRFITRERFVSLLSIRLRAEYFFKKHPDILEQEVYPAWIIVGLQRTGTTKLHRLLAQDPAHRVIPSWEVINPVPIDKNLYDLSTAHRLTRLPDYPLTYPHPKDTRIAKAHTAVRALRFISPGFWAIHPIDVMQPEEDILLLDISFMSTTPEAMMHVPSYASWLENTDQSDAYAYAVKLLKLLQRINPAKRWVLKSPHHLEFPRLIEKHFGDVHFLWPHRNLAESIPSYLSMVTYNRMIFSAHADERQVAEHWVRKIGYMLDQAMEYRLKPGNDSKFTDIYYNDLVTDSIGELDKIYRLDGGLTDVLVKRFLSHERQNPHRKHGIHHYSMADFSLTDAEIERHALRYERFMKERNGKDTAEKIQ